MTRMKENAVYEVVEELRGPAEQQFRCATRSSAFTGWREQARSQCCSGASRFGTKRTTEILVFLTNLLDFGATTIAAIYKDRWQMELFFDYSTWCTPLDVMEFQGSVALNRPLVGAMAGSVRPRIARPPPCAESRVRPHRPVLPATVSLVSTVRQWSA